MTEKEVQDQIREYLEAKGALVWKNYIGPIIAGHGRKGKNHNAGQPDIFAVLPGGRFVAIEVKKPGARPRAHEDKQRDWVKAFQEKGALSILTNNLEDVRALVP